MPRAAPYNRDIALNAAMSLFWDKGYHATSLKDLEACLEMKPGSIYAAFQSKEALYLLALDRYFQRSLENFRAVMARSASPLAGLVGNLLSYADLSTDDAARQACMLTKTLIDTRATDPAIAERTRSYLGQIREEFASGFRQAIAGGELSADADADRLARRYQANIAALRFELHLGTRQDDIAALTQDMVRELTTAPVVSPCMDPLQTAKGLPEHD